MILQSVGSAQTKVFLPLAAFVAATLGMGSAALASCPSYFFGTFAIAEEGGHVISNVPVFVRQTPGDVINTGQTCSFQAQTPFVSVIGALNRSSRYSCRASTGTVTLSAPQPTPPNTLIVSTRAYNGSASAFLRQVRPDVYRCIYNITFPLGRGAYFHRGP